MGKLKQGRLSNDDRSYIKLNRGRVSVEEMAANLSRHPDTVQAWLDKSDEESPPPVPADHAGKLSARVELRNSEKWKRLEHELVADELAYFEEAYVALKDQFRGDVLPSEETQIFDAIKLELLKSRNMVERKKAREAINALEKRRERLIGPHLDDLDGMDGKTKSSVLALDAQLSDAREAEQSRTIEYVKLQERQDSLMKSMKSTRDQRVKDFESGAETLLGLMKKLQHEDFRRLAGRESELMRLAGRKEYERLGGLHAYEDGQLDRPILSAETVGMGDGPDPTPGE